MGDLPEQAGRTRFPIVCLSPQPWDVALPTNRQQVMARAAARGHRVVFVETGGFLGRDLARRRGLLRRLRGVAAAPGVTVVRAPNLAPWGRSSRLACALNAAATAAVLRRVARRLPSAPVLWLYDPCASRLVGRSGERFAVYDCVDDHAAIERGRPRRAALVAAADARAARASRLVFATAAPLVERHRALNPHTHLVRNVGDHAHFAPASDPAFAPPELRALPGPVVGFAGNFLAAKVDLDLLAALADARTGWTLLLAGPARPDTAARLAALAARPNVVWVGPQPYARVPRVVARFDVALIPYVENAYTRSCFPLKLYEYLAAGKPVVAAGLPELAGMEPDVVLARGLDATATAIEAALAARSPADRERRMRLAAANTWDARVATLLDLVAAEVAAS